MYNRWLTYSDELYHHGVKGQKWGVRRDKNHSGISRNRLDEKKVNRISEFAIRKSLLTGKNVRDKRQYRKQKKFESYLSKHLTFSDDYVKAVKERDNFAKRAKRDEYGEFSSKSDMNKAFRLNRRIDKEACKLLGLDENKLTPLARMYIAESVNETFRDRNEKR